MMKATVPLKKTPNWKNLVFKKEKPIEIAGTRLTHWSVECDPSEFTFSGCGIGIDPGANFGITYISELEFSVYNGVMPSAEHQEYGVRAYDLIKQFCHDNCLTSGDAAILEGASYGDSYGQVGLAEIRFGFFLGMRHVGLDPIIVAPATPRRTVLGNGRLQPMDIFPILNHNAADSLVLALHSFMKD
jgi:hypothetical protein